MITLEMLFISVNASMTVFLNEDMTFQFYTWIIIVSFFWWGYSGYHNLLLILSMGKERELVNAKESNNENPTEEALRYFTLHSFICIFSISSLIFSSYQLGLW